MDVLPAVFALIASAIFGFNLHIQNKGLDDTDPMIGAFLSVSTMAVMFWFVAPFVIEWHWFATWAAGLFLLAGLFFPAMGQSLQILSIGKVGPALTSALGAFVPFFAIVPAVLFLGDSFGWQTMFGLSLMIFGLVLAALGRKISRGWPLWALLLPLGAAFVRGVVQPITKFGFTGVYSPFFASMLMASVSTLVLAIILVSSRRLPSIRKRKPGYYWFMLSGMFNGMAILSLNTAIGMGKLSLVAPLATTAPLFALVFGAVVFKREHLGLRHFLIALLVVAGAVLLVMR